MLRRYPTPVAKSVDYKAQEDRYSAENRGVSAASDPQAVIGPYKKPDGHPLPNCNLHICLFHAIISPANTVDSG